MAHVSMQASKAVANVACASKINRHRAAASPAAAHDIAPVPVCGWHQDSKIDRRVDIAFDQASLRLGSAGWPDPGSDNVGWRTFELLKTSPGKAFATFARRWGHLLRRRWCSLLRPGMAGEKQQCQGQKQSAHHLTFHDG